MSWWITFGDVARAQALQLTEGELRALIAEEALLLMLLGWFLRVRGWSVEHFAAYPSRRELAMAAWLTAVMSGSCRGSCWRLPMSRQPAAPTPH